MKNIVNILLAAKELGSKSIAMPMLGMDTERRDFPAETVTSIMIKTFYKFHNLKVQEIPEEMKKNFYGKPNNIRNIKIVVWVSAEKNPKY